MAVKTIIPLTSQFFLGSDYKMKLIVLVFLDFYWFDKILTQLVISSLLLQLIIV